MARQSFDAFLAQVCFPEAAGLKVFVSERVLGAYSLLWVEV